MWGNSLGVRIPKHLSEELRLRAGSEVEVSLKGKVVTIKPVREKKETLHDLVKGITKKNRHGEEWGNMDGPMGHEIW